MYGFRAQLSRAIVLLAVSTPLVGCSVAARLTGSFESPALELEASKVASIAPTRTRLLFEIVARNPNAYALRSSQARYRLTINGTLVAAGEVDTVASLPGQSATTLMLPVVVPFDALSSAAPAALMFGEVPYHLDVWLTVDVWVRRREVSLSTGSVLRWNLPLELAAIAFP